jgi:hypothetical protein
MELRRGVLLVVLLWLAVSCQRPGPQLPADPGLAQDDLGIGLALGTSLTTAREVATSLRSKVELHVLTREELNQQSPFESQTGAQDVVLALYTASSEEEAPAPGPLATGTVDEVRCYLAADAAHSVVKLLGRPAATLTPELATSVFGQPRITVTSPDGQLHCYFYFPYQAESQGTKRSSWIVKLILSFTPLGRCYACALSLADESASGTE